MVKKRNVGIRICSLAFIGLMNYLPIQAQQLVNETLPNPENEPSNVFPVPSERQMKWNETEYYAFFHYGLNTFKDGNNEWGNGAEDPKTYAPTKLPNVEQWIQVAKDAGMKGGIMVAKHHDGFCLWPTESTTHSVKASAGVGPQVNIVDTFTKASAKLGMKYGFYISPWDRNSQYYGEDNYVTDVFFKQVSEVSKYGNEQFEIWFDGANGGDGHYGGKGGSRSIDKETYYDVPNLVDSIHKLQPNAVVWGHGGEARWIGNEQGWAGETNWANRGSVGESSGSLTDGDENGCFWIPGEADTKATNNGWFWNQGESVYDVNKLFKIYMETVGRNATLILNIPPNRDGEIDKNTADVMKQLGTLIKERFSNDFAKEATVTATDTRTNGATKTYVADNVKDGKDSTYWAPNDNVKSNVSLTFTWTQPKNIHYVTLQEYIRKGQRVKGFTIETSNDGKNWTRQASQIKQTTIGYKRIIPMSGSTTNHGSGVSAKYLKVTITDSKACPLLHTISIF